MLIDSEIAQLAQRVAEQFRPERIFLFGSHAAGRADAGSDLDLLVVMEYLGSPVEQAVAIRRFLGDQRPLDLLVRTPQELRYRLRMGDWFFREVMEKGIDLYERADARVD